MPSSEASRRLPAEALTLWRLQAIVGCLVGCVLAAAAWLYWRDVAWVQILAVGVAAWAVVGTVFDMLWLLPRRLAYYRYEVDGTGTRIRQGRVFERRLLVPADQILFTELRQGPWQRRLGLGTVRMGTLGSVHDLGPVELGTAKQICDSPLSRQGPNASV
ncbi:MAG: hypothetical protein CVT62_05770 [Actinobacteria bacterium HGW-Actinobacteria-2]|nr:MAG: hypothetical protein CVT62_05770 [Actinobacteria bacterium HGW-Actinobacteria-2]